MLDSNHRVAAALSIPTALLNAWVWLGFFFLALGGMADIPELGYVALIAGAGLAAVGLRALVLPPRPFDPGVPAMRGVLRSSRAVGAFYVFAGAVWIVLAWTVAQA